MRDDLPSSEALVIVGKEYKPSYVTEWKGKSYPRKFLAYPIGRLHSILAAGGSSSYKNHYYEVVVGNGCVKAYLDIDLKLPPHTVSPLTENEVWEDLLTAIVPVYTASGGRSTLQYQAPRVPLLCKVNYYGKRNRATREKQSADKVKVEAVLASLFSVSQLRRLLFGRDTGAAVSSNTIELFGHPTVKIDQSVKAWMKKGLVRTPKEEGIGKILNNMFKHVFCKQFYRKNKTWPSVEFVGPVPHAIQTSIEKNPWLEKDKSPWAPDCFQGVKRKKSFDFNYHQAHRSIHGFFPTRPQCEQENDLQNIFERRGQCQGHHQSDRDRRHTRRLENCFCCAGKKEV